MNKTTILKIATTITMAFSLCGCSILSFFIDKVENNKTNKTSVVIVGVENGYAGKCDGSLKDAKRMKSELSKYSKDVVMLLDSAATTSAVLDAMYKSVENNLAIIYFSGHGGSQSGGIDEADGNDEFICCYDGNIMDDEIWNVICQSNGRVFLIFDCCCSQTMYKSPSFQFKQTQYKSYSLKNGYIPNMLCWSGCPDNSYSYGSSNGGYFTNALLQHCLTMYSYETVWDRISSDIILKSHQKVKQTKLGDFNTDKKVFR